jgi:hypothetical protein
MELDTPRVIGYAFLSSSTSNWVGSVFGTALTGRLMPKPPRLSIGSALEYLVFSTGAIDNEKGDFSFSSDSKCSLNIGLSATSRSSLYVQMYFSSFSVDRILKMPQKWLSELMN